jgi:putative membrane protein
MYLYLKALHIIFVVTWFSGLFYVVRLFIYNTEALEKPESERLILQHQFSIMIRRLWLGITWPSAILTFLFGIWMWTAINATPRWLFIKLLFVGGLLIYHCSLHLIYRQQLAGKFKYTSTQLRIWNEVATIFLIAIVMIVVVKQSISLLWGGIGLIALMILFMVAVRIYKRIRMSSR